MENLWAVLNNNNNGTPQRNVQYRPATSFLEIKTEKQVQQLFCVQEKLSDDNWCNLCSPTHLLPNIWPKSSRSSCTLLKIWSMIWQENVYVKQNYCIFSVHPILSMLLHYKAVHMPHFGICLKHSEQNDNVYWGAACYYCPYKAKMLKKLSKNCTNICQNNWKRTLVQRKNHFDVRRNISKGGKKVLCGFFFTET